MCEDTARRGCTLDLAPSTGHDGGLLGPSAGHDTPAVALATGSCSEQALREEWMGVHSPPRASLCYLVPEFCLLGKRPVASGPVLTSVGWVRPRPHFLPTVLLDTSLALWLLSPSLCPYLSLLFPTLHFSPSLKDTGFTKGSLGQMAEDAATTTLATAEEPAGAHSGQRLSRFAVRGLEDAVERGPALALHSTLPLLFTPAVKSSPPF